MSTQQTQPFGIPKSDQKSSRPPYEIAQDFILKENYEAAFPYLKQAGEANNPLAYIWLYHIYNQGYLNIPINHEEAAYWKQKIIDSRKWYEAEAQNKKGSRFWEAQFALGYIYANGINVQADLAKALEHYKAAQATGPYSLIKCFCAQAHFQLRQFDTSLESYQDALKMKPDSVWALNGCGNASIVLNRLDDASKYFTEAIKIDPNNAISFNGRALIFMRKNQDLLARSDFEKALEINPVDEAVQVNYIKLLKKLNKSEAVQNLAAILDKDVKGKLRNLSQDTVNQLRNNFQALTGNDYGQYLLEHQKTLEQTRNLLANSAIFSSGQSIVPPTANPGNKNSKQSEEFNLASIVLEYYAEPYGAKEEEKQGSENVNSCIIL